MRNPPEPDFPALIESFEAARRDDPRALASLKTWFDACVASILGGREARHQLGLLAYLVAERQATRSLSHNGRFNDLPNDPGSVASQHWERFQPFCEDLEQGRPRTVDDFVARVDALTQFVLLDLAAARNKIRDHERPIVDEAQLADLVEEDEDDPGPDDPESIERKRVVLRQIFQVLRPKLFIVVILRGYCGFKWAEIAEILGTTIYYVRQDYDEATRLIGEQMG